MHLLGGGDVAGEEQERLDAAALFRSKIALEARVPVGHPLVDEAVLDRVDPRPGVHAERIVDEALAEELVLEFGGGFHFA
jgi:hypothetical protein